ncbi:unconventional myosin-XVIIIa isoform X6 [Sitodiplosis mosellana]|uniref:unconventional myosin-XVIIIa isoform X6 n=1 Tax=Sitodiplosis mosellana TaxID=263140 RepID=UPI002443B9AB|nr:unconventional myosin-XVIIIa isoform X6 [Sitodiplosis mosellana]
MPHSESQLVSDLVKESINSNVRPRIISTKTISASNGENGENLVVPRPPLPPKVPKPIRKITLNSTSSDLSQPSTLSNAAKVIPKLSLPRSRTPINIDLNNNSFLSLSRNSSLHSIESFNSFRSISPSLLQCSNNSLNSRRSLRSLTPRRVFPQAYTPSKTIDLSELQSLDNATTVFDGKLSFVLGCKNQRVHQQFRSSPAHLSEADTASRYLSEKISDFLKRTDHINEEWRSHCRRSASVTRNSCDVFSIIEDQRSVNDEMSKRLTRSKSVTNNIMTKAFQMAQKLPPTERSNSVCRERCGSVLSVCSSRVTIDDDNDTIVDDELSEMTADLTEERSTSNITTERLEAETAERLKLEKELQQQQEKVRSLQDMSEKLEMELICAKSDLNGISEDEDAENDDGHNSSVYKMKYERAAKELEFTKRRLQTQHEHDLDQLVGLKKQLEKKLADAYEEVEEQRQVVGQWKRKSQKLSGEMNDLRMLLDEQNGRNNVLEKKQRKFDAESQSLQDAVRQEKQTKERLSREKDVLIAEKFNLEQQLADTRLELDMKDETLTSLRREMEEMTHGGGSEEEFAQLKKAKIEAEKLCKEQEEELDEMAGQISLLEQAKLRLEMSLETMRKEARRESQQRDDELEEVRGSSYKKIKALECQLETEHEERTLLLREKHELERRLKAVEEQDRVDRAAEDAANQKLKRDLRKYKALLKDAQAQIERMKADSPGKVLVRQLRNQIEDAETARAIAVKMKNAAETELADLQLLFDEANRGRNEADSKASQAQREKGELQIQFEENEEEMAELMKKYSSVVNQLNVEQSTIAQNEIRIVELESERNSLKEQVEELHIRLENVESITDTSTNIQTKRLEMKVKELESRLELEQATRGRLEVQFNRYKDALEKAQQEASQTKAKEQIAQDSLKKVQKSLRELREESHQLTNRENDHMAKRKDLEVRYENSQTEVTSLKNDLRLALQRIADLQQAMEDVDDDDDGSTESDSSDTSEDSQYETSAIMARRSIQLKSNTNGILDRFDDDGFNSRLRKKLSTIPESE